MRKLPIGSQVIVRDWVNNAWQERPGTVLRHGHNTFGIYTEIRLEDTGEVDKFHRSALRLSETRAIIREEVPAVVNP